MKDPLQQIKESNDNYLNTIYAIIGFMNVYKFELEKDGSKVKLFQGRKLDKKNEPSVFVTPDIGILIDDKSGLIGEVKNTFPKEQSQWKENFKQLLNYDSNLIGWPNKSEVISSHDVVLLIHDSQSVPVRDYFLSKEKKGEIKFRKPFIIVEYARSDEAKPFFRFRIQHGRLSLSKIHDKLYNGLPVPLDIFAGLFSKIKIYDTEPHLSWMLWLIYSCILDKATGEGKYHKLNKNVKLDIDTSINEVTDLLYQTYSFHPFHKNHQNRQAKFPKEEWVKKGVQKLIALHEASWINESKGDFRFSLKRYEPILEHYVLSCIEDQRAKSQMSLFKKEEM